MNLQPMNPKPAEGMRVVCIKCSRMVPASGVLCDLDGPAYAAYYCGDCAMHIELDASEGAGMLPHSEDMRRVVTMIKAAGFRVFMRSPSDTWCYYTDGTRIAYAQSGRFRESLTTTHIPNRTTGTGFHYADEITPENIRGAIACHAPSWAWGRDAEASRKWRDWDTFRNSDAFNRAYREV